jgi:hypothetical protein
MIRECGLKVAMSLTLSLAMMSCAHYDHLSHPSYGKSVRQAITQQAESEKSLLQRSMSIDPNGEAARSTFQKYLRSLSEQEPKNSDVAKP